MEDAERDLIEFIKEDADRQSKIVRVAVKESLIEKYGKDVIIEVFKGGQILKFPVPTFEEDERKAVGVGDVNSNVIRLSDEEAGIVVETMLSAIANHRLWEVPQGDITAAMIADFKALHKTSEEVIKTIDGDAASSRIAKLSLYKDNFDAVTSRLGEEMN